MAVDGSGNVFVADYDHSAVKEILAAGGYASVNTVGSGFTYPTGVAVDGSGNVFVADWGNTSSAVKEIVAGTGGATSGTVSSLSIVNTVHSGIDLLSHLYGVAVDGSGDVFFTLQNGNVVEEIVAGTGSAASGTVSSDSTVKTVGSGFNRPSGLAVDGSGNVFVADSFNNAVKEILAVGGYSTVRSVGIGFISPYGVAVDGIGNVFVADYFNNAVKEILSGTGSAKAARFRQTPRSRP